MKSVVKIKNSGDQMIVEGIHDEQICELKDDIEKLFENAVLNGKEKEHIE